MSHRWTSDDHCRTVQCSVCGIRVTYFVKVTKHSFGDPHPRAEQYFARLGDAEWTCSNSRGVPACKDGGDR